VRDVVRIAGATLAFAGVHSLLASRAAKRVAARLAGERRRNGLYRVLYVAQAVVTTGALTAAVRPLSGPVVWRARGRAAALLVFAQAGGAWLLVAAAKSVGLRRLAGLESLAAFRRGDPVVAAEPEAQGPAPDAAGRLRADGPFRASRHPLNLAPLPILWCAPLMTRNLLVFNVLATIYLVLGSRHEEARLAAAYGPAYERYRRSGVPFYVPSPPGIPPRSG
jgi:hypothetical protein